jgi:hypothetical protein
VTLTMTFSGCGTLTANFSNNNVVWGADVPYDSVNPTVAWAHSSGDGNKTVYGKIRSISNNWTLNPQSIILDTVKPTTPGTLTRTVSCSGSDRTTNLTWGSSSDTYLVGYRVYRSTDGASWNLVPPTLTGISKSDVTKKSLTSVRYYVAAYDRAGNESVATNIVTLSKNQCS